MSESEFPEEAGKTVYQRDKTAKEPVKADDDSAKPKVKPKIKPKKVFVPKKTTFQSDKPMEHRVRHIRLSTADMAKVIHETLVELQKELAAQPMDDPDKEFHDREKVENFFAKLAKKYSTCGTRLLGGDLGWIYKDMKIISDETLTPDLVETILKTEKYTLPEPIQTRLGQHLILVCESQVRVEKTAEEPVNQPKKPLPGSNIPT